MIFLGTGCALVLGMLWFGDHLHDTRKPAVEIAPATRTPPGASTGAMVDGATPAVIVAGKPVADKAALEQLNKAIGDALGALRSPVVSDKKRTLTALRQLLAGVDPTVAVAAIRQFLASKEDAATGLLFKVGTNGVLDESPTLRTFMMDRLGIIGRGAGMADAGEVGRETLAAEKTSAEEWAVAMRNVGWTDPQGSKTFLAEKARELIDHEPWRQLHSSGYLQAFDAAAYSGDATLLDKLAPLAKTPSPVQQAAIVAMDRLSALAPDKVSSYLNSHPDFMADRPMFRADYMGRVNLSDPNQLGQAEIYLRRTDVTLEEKTKFLGRLGLPAGFVSNNLLTPPQAQSINLLDHRALVNQTAMTWLNSGQYPTLQASLERLITNTGPAN